MCRSAGVLQPTAIQVDLTALLSWNGLLCLLFGLIGCDRTSDWAKSQPNRIGRPVGTGSAERLLEQVASVYGRLKSYEDSARVVLTYSVAGARTQDVAPLSVAFERPNRVGIKAYQVTAGVADERLRMRLSSDPISPLRSQVLSRALPAQLTFSWIMSDALAAQHLSAGLAGAPPQLELLFSDHPFQSLVDESAQVTMDGQGSEGDSTYNIVKIVRGQAIYRIWIDSESTLIRRIELPTSTLPSAMLSDKRITDVRLSIELDEVQTDRPVDWSQWRVAPMALDQWVRYFVAPPALSVDPRLGKSVPAFRLSPPSEHVGGVPIDTSVHSSNDQIQLLIWLADHRSCRETVQQVSQALAMLPGTLRKKIAPIAVWAESEPASGTTFATLSESWKLNMPLVQDRQALGRDLLAIHEAPTIIILDRHHRLQFFQAHANPQLVQALPEILHRLANGENFAETMNKRVETELKHYQAQLWHARSSDASVGAFTQPTAYGPAIVRLEELERKSSKERILALTSDGRHNQWSLKSDGSLDCFDSRGQSQPGYRFDGFNDQQLPARIAVDANGQFVALWDSTARTARILDTQTGRTITVTVANSDNDLTDLRWLTTPVGVRLAAISSGGKTLMVDPTSEKQHSGISPARPVAILDRVAEDSVASGYVILNDGRVEPVIVQDQVGAKQATKAVSVSSNSGALNSPIERKLSFAPSIGPWSMWSDAKDPAKGSATLANGWIAIDEPGVFLLDRRLRQIWHAPLPIVAKDRNSASSTVTSYLSCVANDPVSGQPMWVVASPDETLHFFRYDAVVADHCRLNEPVHGLAMVPNGNELQLWIAHPHAIVRMRVF